LVRPLPRGAELSCARCSKEVVVCRPPPPSWMLSRSNDGATLRRRAAVHPQRRRPTVLTNGAGEQSRPPQEKHVRPRMLCRERYRLPHGENSEPAWLRRPPLRALAARSPLRPPHQLPRPPWWPPTIAASPSVTVARLPRSRPLPTLAALLSIPAASSTCRPPRRLLARLATLRAGCMLAVSLSALATRPRPAPGPGWSHAHHIGHRRAGHGCCP
jgi:hypothetical protein